VKKLNRVLSVSLALIIALFFTGAMSAIVRAQSEAPSVTLDPFPDYTNNKTPTFTGTATMPPFTCPIASVEYRVDSGSWNLATAVDAPFGDSTTEPYTFTTEVLDDGSHTVEVKATNNAGDTTGSANYATVTFTVDTVAPSVILTALTPDPTNDPTPTFSGTATDTPSPIASVEYQVDSGEWTPAQAVDRTFDSTSEVYTFTTATLTDGLHTVWVRATDAAGNVSTLVSDAFTLDTTGPAVTLTALTPDPTANNTPTLNGIATDTYSIVTSVEYRVDDEAWTAATPVDGAFDTTSESYAFATATLADGSHTVEVKATDAVGNNATTSDTFTVDTGVPSVILTPLSPDPTSNTTPTLSGTATDDTGTWIASVEYRADSGNWTAAEAVDGTFDTASEAYTFTTAPLADGSHTVKVRATDAAGNVSTLASDTFTVDTALPLVTINDIPDSVNQLDSISGTALDTSPGQLDKVQVAINNTNDDAYWDSTSWVATEIWLDATGTISWSYSMPALTDGNAYTVKAKSIDKAGNGSAVASDSFTFDITPPSVSIDDIPDLVKELDSISGTASDTSPGQLDKVQVAINNTNDGTYWDSTNWIATEIWLDATGTDSWSYTMPSLTDGKAYTVKAKSIDAAGNESAQASDSFTFDTTQATAPEPASPEEGLSSITIALWIIILGVCGLTLVIVFIKRWARI